MSNKIGRNDLCPCGSGKKNKKCHNIDRLPIITNNTNTKDLITGIEKYVKTHESKHILNEIIGMQLLSENHGKNLRIEALAALVATNLNNGKGKDVKMLYESIKKEYSHNYNEDPAENMYSENVIFFGGNFTVFPGIALEPVEIFKHLSQIIYNTNIKLPNEFRNQVYQGIMLLLFLGQKLTTKAGIHGNLDKKDSVRGLSFFNSDIDFSISKSELEKICGFLEIDPNIINDFIISPDDNLFQNDDPMFNPLLLYPIVEFNNEYFFLLVSNQVNAINEYILRLAKQYNCEKDLLSSYRKEIWAEIEMACHKMGWTKTNIKLLENKDNSDLEEAIFYFDHDRLAYVSLRTPSEVSDSYSYTSSRNDEDVEKRFEGVISDLKSRKELSDSKFLSLQLYDSIGRSLFGQMRKPQDRELKLSFSAFNFIVLTEGEDWSRLSLWKFAKALDIFLNKTRSMSSMIDIYNMYKLKGQGFYFSDDRRPEVAMFVNGEGSELIRETKLKINYHATEININGEIVLIPVTRIADFAPIYKPIRHIGYFLQSLETFKIPIWITNRQIKKDSMVASVRLYADAIFFWLHKLKPALSDYFNSITHGPLEIQLVLNVATFKELTSIEMKEQKDDNKYSYTYKDGKITFNIPFSSLSEFMGSKNEGERTMMNEVLNSLNLIDGISISKDEINKIIDSHIPLNQAKMILISDSQQDFMVDRRWLVEPFLLTNGEVEILLDELPDLIEQKISIPEKITVASEKKQLFNTVTTILLEKLESEIGMFDNDSLLLSLLKLHESLVQKREYNKTIIPAQLLCFGGVEVKVNEILENEKNLVRTSVALRALIEYLASQPIKGAKQPGFDDIDRLLALMHEVVNYGFLSDAVHFKMDDPEVGKLPSGRIGISSGFFDEKIKPFTESNTKAEIDDYIANFEDRFEIYSPVDEKDVDPDIAKSLEELDDAFLHDWGITFSNLYILYYQAAEMCMQAEKSVITMTEENLIKKFIDDFKIPKEQIIAGIAKVVLFPRDSYLKAPESYNNSEVFPWKYNREFSLTRRFLIRHIGSEGEILLSWGFRTAIATQRQLGHLLHNGKLNNGGVKINKLIGAFNLKKGKVFRNNVRDWLKTQSDFTLIDYEVVISPSGHLKADKDYGDVDVMALHNPSGTVFSIECKNTTKAKNIHEMKTEMDSYLGREGGKGMITKHIERHDWLIQNTGQLQKFLKTETTLIIKSFMLSSEVIPTPYIKSESLPMPIIAFHDLKREGVRILF